MGRKRTVKSTIVIPTKENNEPRSSKHEKVRETHNIPKGKRSRSEGDTVNSNDLMDFKNESTKHISRKEKEETKSTDLRNVISEKRRARSTSRSNSRSRARQRLSPRQSEEESDEELKQLNKTQTDKRSLSSDTDEDRNRKKYRQEGKKFYSERNETVTTPLDYEFFEEENSESEFYSGIKPTNDESEVTFNKTKLNLTPKGSKTDEKEKDVSKKRKKSRSKSRSVERERRHRKKYKRKYYTSSEDGDSSDSSSYKSYKWRNNKKRNRRKKKRRYSSSSEEESDVEFDKISKIVKQYVKKGKSSDKEDQVTQIVKQVVKQINQQEGKPEIHNSGGEEYLQTNNEVIKENETAIDKRTPFFTPKIKSPSMATLYTPALDQVSTRNHNLPRFAFDNAVTSPGSPQIVSNNFFHE